MSVHHRDVVVQTSISHRFLNAVQGSYQAYLEHGARSNEKLKILHGWIIEEIGKELGDEYTISGLTHKSSSEKSVEGMYYSKKVDLLVARDN